MTYGWALDPPLSIYEVGNAVVSAVGAAHDLLGARPVD